MSLQVWLPLNGNLNNNGIGNITISGSPTFNDAGKIGKCLASQVNFTTFPWMTFRPENNFSLAIWAKGNVTSSTTYIIACTAFELRITTSNIRVGWGGSASEPAVWTATVDTNTWYHICFTWEGTTKLLKLYINGDLKATSNVVGNVPTSIAATANLPYNGSRYLNDFRIYNHCLSAREVREISRGLVAHYKLDDRSNAGNLIVNGFGQQGQENWNTSSYSTTEIPSSNSNIKASYYAGNSTKEYIPINVDHSYTISGYVKSTGATTGNTYPSIFPFDYDKKFIAYYNSAAGFATTYLTTLSQPLKKGDTVIHATNLSAWTTANNNYYFHVAIFGYRNSSGYVYPDMVYTADSPVFGSYSDKSHIDKTNNTITLNSAFTGEDRPAGTAICQATEGSTYFYPWGGIALSSISDWTFKTATFIPKNELRLKAAAYFTWNTYSNVYIAGNKLIDNTAHTDVVVDCSGYGNNGSLKGSTDNFEVEPNTARYRYSSKFNGTDNAIQIPFNNMINDQFTITGWMYKRTIGTDGYQTLIGGPGGFELEARNSSATDPLFRLHNWGGGTTPYEFNKWTFFAFTRNSSETKFYVNGELKLTGTAGTIPSGNYFIGAWNTSTQQNFEGNLSDYRIYSTVLTQADIKELYETGQSIDNNGSIYAYELVEA